MLGEALVTHEPRIHSDTMIESLTVFVCVQVHQPTKLLRAHKPRPRFLSTN